MFWSNEANIPDWVKDLSAGELLVEMQRRVEYLVPRYNQRYLTIKRHQWHLYTTVHQLYYFKPFCRIIDWFGHGLITYVYLYHVIVIIMQVCV